MLITRTKASEEKLEKLIRFIEENDFWVTAQQCAEAYGCETPAWARLLINQLKKARRLPRQFRPVMLRKGSPLAENLHLVPKLVSLERKATELSEMAIELDVSRDSLKSMRSALKHHRHPKYLDALDKRRVIEKKTKIERMNQPTKSEEKHIIADRELKKLLGMGIEELNAYNCVHFYSETLMKMIMDPMGTKESLGLDSGDTNYLRRHGLIKTKMIPTGGLKINPTIKALGYLYMLIFLRRKKWK
ncbi:MAG: hypothetical protein NWF07_09575 [Candidatus Bathyarchaeota archaeon]|nr:hypothetical protein [Candidatus Bathyarchaeota archaeon]